MIIDKIENRALYSLPSGLQEALEYFAVHDLNTMEIGKYTLPNGLTMKIDEYVPEKEGGLYEGHEHTAHLRYLASGSERLGYANKNEMCFNSIVEGKEDKALYKGEGSVVRIPTGTFVVLFPQDCHLLKLKDTDNVTVRKVSVSIKL